MKLSSVIALGIAGGLLAGCHAMTLEEAQAQCTKQGGLLVILYSQKLTLAGPGPVEATPGQCVSPSRFRKPDAPATGAAPANPPARDSAIAAPGAPAAAN